MNNWSNFESFVESLLEFDFGKKAPGSGSVKMEEDVIGLSTVSQCKTTETKNISILTKDLQRLNKAAALLDKFPLFFLQSNDTRALVLQINADTESIIINVMKLIVIMFCIKRLYMRLKVLQNKIYDKTIVKNELRRINELYCDIKTALDNSLDKINAILDQRS